MNTGNTKYLDTKNNREFYSTSDGMFMPTQQILRCHEVLQRIAWARAHIHEKGCRTVLDVGCKDGYMCMQLTDEGKDCLAIDPSADAIARAKKLAEELDLDVKYICSFWEDYDLSKDEEMRKMGKYDAVVCLEVIEHVTDAEKFLEKLAVAGRYVFISTPDHDGRHGMEDAKRNETHVRIYTQEELVELCSKFGDVIDCQIIDDQLCICIRTG